MRDRVLLLIPTTSYKAEDFLAAAERLQIDVVVGSDRRQTLEHVSPGTSIKLDFRSEDPDLSAVEVLHTAAPFSAVVGSDDEATVLASRIAARLGLPHNDDEAVRATRDKFLMREAFRRAGVRSPGFRRVSLDAPAQPPPVESGYPCVLKPLHLSASRGVIRADNPAEFRAAFDRIRSLLASDELRGQRGDGAHILVEDYLPGAEVALEGLLDRGRLQLLALFDKPDALEGPFFEETIYVTPSRKPAEVQQAICEEVAAGCRALGLRHGPVHAELRLDRERPRLLEIAARTIGGLCARTLRFGTGIALEEWVLRHAVGRDLKLTQMERASGVMMIPIPGAGVLRGVDGLKAARDVPGVEEITLTRHRGSRLTPLPEGHAYLGFIFATGSSPEIVEQHLRQSHAHLTFDLTE